MLNDSVCCLYFCVQVAPPAADSGHSDLSKQPDHPAGTFLTHTQVYLSTLRAPDAPGKCSQILSLRVCLSCSPAELCCDVPAGGTPRRQTVTVQRPAEQSFSQQFVRPQQLLEGKVTISTNVHNPQQPVCITSSVHHVRTITCFRMQRPSISG